MRYIVGFCLAMSIASANGAGIVFDNQSGRDVKLAAPGGSATLTAHSGPVEIPFEDSDDIGVDINIWWVAKPLQLCRIFTPWQRLVVISGSHTIRCRSVAAP